VQKNERKRGSRQKKAFDEAPSNVVRRPVTTKGTKKTEYPGKKRKKRKQKKTGGWARRQMKALEKDLRRRKKGRKTTLFSRRV